ncbi:glycoside hydrolase family 13 protein [Paenibacillus ihuae]|uniref:glycoside hydrolase family 13 protein n=1 Tax=Paenibacillus ihuae TaxID=1232431 RepID=UPI0006D5726A|nr:alpha-glucosidase [Paenibacillus ihuae]
MNKKWWKEAVIYHIYPRSFRDSNGDGIGDLQGIIEKLDYIQSLGVDIIWLGPVYASPNDDNGYDVSDYYQIHDDFGTLEEWERLKDDIHRRGMKIMMDIVLNHTSDEHAWFEASRLSRDNPYRDYYHWHEGKEGREPNNWGSVFSGSAWEQDPKTGDYYLHLFSRKQPDLNWGNPKVREAMYSMMRYWLDKGVDGFRLDAVNLLCKPDGLPDSPLAAADSEFAPCGPLVANGEGIHGIFQEMNREVFSPAQTFTIAEMANVTAEEGLLYTASDRLEFNSIIGFEHMDVDNGPNGRWETIPFDLVALKRILNSWQTALNGRGWFGLYLNNHDQPRVVSRWGNDVAYWKESATMFATCLHMMQGTLFIYQGEEIGMTNMKFADITQYRDIETLNYYRHETAMGRPQEQVMADIYTKSRDNARTPMQWNTEPHAGFSSSEPWIGVNPNFTDINVEAQEDDPASILNYYRLLVQLRKRHDVIVYGDFTPLLEDHPAIYAYQRTLCGEKLFVVANFTAEEQKLTAVKAPENAKLLLANYEKADGEPDELVLRPYEARVYLAGTA